MRVVGRLAHARLHFRATLVVRTELWAAAVFQHQLVGGVQTRTTQEVSDFGAIYQAIATIPEIEQVEHLLYV